MWQWTPETERARLILKAPSIPKLEWLLLLQVSFEDHWVSFNKLSNFSRSIWALASCQSLISFLSQPVITVLIPIPNMSFGRLNYHISKMSTQVSSWEELMHLFQQIWSHISIPCLTLFVLLNVFTRVLLSKYSLWFGSHNSYLLSKM